MKIQVLFFAQLKEIFGESERWMEVPEGCRIREVVEMFRLPAGQAGFAQHDKIRGIPIIFAVNENYENEDKKLADQDQLAVMMPVSGG